MKAPRCRVCGVEGWRHVCGATNAVANATNAATNKKVVATNRSQGALEVSGLHEPTKVGSNPAPATRTANRRARVDYNAYQRVLMQLRRALATGRAERWPRIHVGHG